VARYRAAVIGCGFRGRAHIRAYEGMEEAEVVACCDIAAARREEVAAELGITAFADADQMLKAEKPDIVHIATPPDARVGVMTSVSDMGVPLCTVEKPIATGVRDWRELVALEARSKTRFAVCHQFRWHEHLVKCREALASGKLGAVLFLDFSAGMNISGQGTHILNYGMSLNGESPTVQVFGSASGFSEKDSVHPAPDNTVGYLTFANGVRALWSNGGTAPRVAEPEVEWKHVRVAAYAEKGRVLWEEFGRWEIVSPKGVETGSYGDMDTWTANNVKAQAAFHMAMIGWLEQGATAGTNLKQSLHEWQTVLALYASALWRRPVEMDRFDPPEDLFEQLARGLAGGAAGERAPGP